MATTSAGFKGTFNCDTTFLIDKVNSTAAVVVAHPSIIIKKPNLGIVFGNYLNLNVSSDVVKDTVLEHRTIFRN